MYGALAIMESVLVGCEAFNTNHRSKLILSIQNDLTLMIYFALFDRIACSSIFFFPQLICSVIGKLTLSAMPIFRYLDQKAVGKPP